MKTLSSLQRIIPVVAAAGFLGALSLRAQYNPPPPPEEQGGPSPAMDQTGPPPGEPNAAPPSYDPNSGAPPPPVDPNAPPTDSYGQPLNQPPPPSDQGAPPDQGAMQDPSAPPSDQDADADASGDANFQTFYDNLSSQGSWVQTENYGYVWQPNEDDPDWRPYTNGHWVYSDEGWTWVADSSEPWGWATYHYGRWVNIDGTGWVWVPGYTWAPAWVSWRYGGGYCGWAPLPPDTFEGIDFGGEGFGFHIGGDCDTAYDIGPGWYNFVPVGYLGARDYRGHYLDRNNNYAFIGRTRNVTNIVVNNQVGAGRFGRVRVGGPSFAAVNAQSQTPVQRVALARTSTVGNARMAGNRLSVFAPHVASAGATGSFHPRSVAGHLATVRVNNGANINQPLAVNARVRPSGPSAAQVQAANAAHPSAAARVATVNTRPTQTLSRPLTSFQPHTEVHSHATTASAPVQHTTSTHVRPESAFTGGSAAPEERSPIAPHETTEVHHAASQAAPSTSSGTYHHTSAAPEHHEEAPSIHSASASVPHEESHPSVSEHHFEAPAPQHEEVHSAPAAPHQDVHPPAAQHAAGPAGHPGPPAHAGPGGNHDPHDKDDKQH